MTDTKKPTTKELSDADLDKVAGGGAKVKVAKKQGDGWITFGAESTTLKGDALR